MRKVARCGCLLLGGPILAAVACGGANDAGHGRGQAQAGRPTASAVVQTRPAGPLERIEMAVHEVPDPPRDPPRLRLAPDRAQT